MKNCIVGMFLTCPIGYGEPKFYLSICWVTDLCKLDVHEVVIGEVLNIHC